MKPWRVIQAGIVTPKGDASTLDAPAILKERFAALAGSGPPVEARFDRSLPMARAAYLTCQAIHQVVEQALDQGQRPLLLGGECSLIAGSLAPALERIPDLRLAFFDAHGDFNTPETSPSQYLGGMCFAHVCGLFNAGLPWRASRAFPPERALLIGGRDLDPGEVANLRRAGVLRLDPSTEDAPLRLKQTVTGAPLWIHVDLDVVDPSENFAVSHPAPGGISFQRLEMLVAQLPVSDQVCGLEVCGYLPAKDPQRLLPTRIEAAVTPAIRT